MAESGKLTDKAAELAGQAAAAAGPFAAQARERATAFAAQAAAAAGPIAEQARVRAAQGVDVLAGNLDKLSGGKYSEQIHSLASRVEEVLDGGRLKPPAAAETVEPTPAPSAAAETVEPTPEPPTASPETAPPAPDAPPPTS